MPTEFTALIERKNKNELDSNWTTHCVDLGDLLFCTQCEMENSGIQFKKKTDNNNGTTPTPLRMSIYSLERKIKSEERNKFPEAFPRYYDLKKEVIRLKEEGKTRPQVETLFKTPYTPNHCWLCRIKNNRHDLQHKDVECLILKSIYPYCNSSLPPNGAPPPCSSPLSEAPTTVCQALTTRTPLPQSSTDKCCYDSGTWP